MEATSKHPSTTTTSRTRQTISIGLVVAWLAAILPTSIMVRHGTMLPVWLAAAIVVLGALVMANATLGREPSRSTRINNAGIALLSLSVAVAVFEMSWVPVVRGILGALGVGVVGLAAILTIQEFVKGEFEKLLLAESSAMAFWILVVGIAAHTAAHESLGLPRIDQQELGLIALGAWLVSLVIVRRKRT